MSPENAYLLLFAAAVALVLVLVWWPEGPEYLVLQRLSEGDTSPDVFTGIPDRTVKEFLTYEEDSDLADKDPEFSRFANNVRMSARVTLERRRASR